ncbi:uncharacterized protein EI90DRAFT_3049316 [Cantharellus anzutake]|uniref:uncharacterized protein n=1 Tax=Cantharellus anzutake TaxID=1750568 RepID=UPI001904941C|nr:uncharacterized protein EI90DRAFT_3049316 [Cantharellus anzutake]KAF8335055.1 hypothetical protein EI90DRAFT_3049316 [Cantharellus anzutake]
MPLRIKSQRSEYSPDEVKQYLLRISFQVTDGSPFSPDSPLPEPTLGTLSRIMLYHLTSIPFENTSIHYESQHAVDVSPKGAFHRFVSLGKGGYCMQHGTVLLHILRALGYNTFPCAARVYIQNDQMREPNHMALIVSLPTHLDSSSSLYLVDTGFGGPNIRDGGEEHRVIRTRHVGSSFEEAEDGHLDEEWGALQVLWTLQSRQLQFASAGDGGWRNGYAIMPSECVQEDFNAMNFVTFNNPESRFVKEVIIAQFFLSPSSSSWSPSPSQHPDLYPVDPTRIGRHIIFGSRYSIRTGTSQSRNDIVPEFASEMERIRAIAGVVGSLCDAPPNKEAKSLAGSSRTKSGEERPLPNWADGEVPDWAKAAREAIRGRQPELK